MAHNRLLRLGFLLTLMWLLCANAVPSYSQRVWTRVSSGLNVHSLRFPTADTGYAVAGDSLVRTTDGGQSWSKVDLPVSHLRGGFSPALTFFGGHGWLLTAEPGPVDNGLARLLRTTDYGFTWSLIPIDSSWTAQTIYFKSPSLGYMLGNPFRITTDSGRSWQTRTVPPIGPWGSGSDAVGQPNVILGESDGELWVTPWVSIDTGATWHRIDSLVHHFGITDEWMTYIGSSTWILHNAWTTDNGHTWDSVPTSAQRVIGPMVTDTLGHGMFTGYADASGYDNFLYFTNDFGHSWDSVKAPFARLDEGVINGDVWYILAARPDSESGTALYRSVAATSSVLQAKAPSQFRILTNPASHLLKVVVGDFPNDLRIVDFLGRIIGRYSTHGCEYSIDVSSLPEGLYWVVTNSSALPFMHIRE